MNKPFARPTRLARLASLASLARFGAGLSDFIKDDDGRLSSMRLMCLLADVVVLGLWIWGNLKAGQYVPLGYAEAGLLGAAHGCKAGQAWAEYGGGYSNSGGGRV